MTKKYRLIYTGKEIVNSDYLEEQEGTTYVPSNLETFECDTLAEMEAFVSKNKLVYLDPSDIENKEVELQAAKAQKIVELEAYDTSDAVNSFIFGGQSAWFPAAVRSSLATSLESARLLNENSIIFLIDGAQIALNLTEAAIMLATIQRYADACFIATGTHQQTIAGLQTKAEVELYDFTQGYPTKIEF